MKKTSNKRKTFADAFSFGMNWVRRRWTLVLAWFGVQFVFAGLAVVPLVHGFNGMFGHSRMGLDLLHGRGAETVIEWLVHRPGTVSFAFSWLVALGFLYTAAVLFLNGGVLGALATQKTSFHDAAGYGSRYFLRFVRVLLFAFPFFLAVGIVWILSGAVFGAVGKDSENLQTVFLAIRVSACAVCLCAIHMVSDYVKIVAVSKNRAAIRKALPEGFRFVRGHASHAVLLYAAVRGVGVVLLLAYGSVSQILGLSAGIIGFFILQQAYAFLRIAVRIWLLAAQFRFYTGRR